MDQSEALGALGALSHETRLSVFRLLVTAGTDGLPAGEIASRLGVVGNTLSAHLAVLSRAGLVASERHGRSIRYAADYARMRGLIAFLVRDCCAGNLDVCRPLVDLAENLVAAPTDGLPKEEPIEAVG